MTGNELKTLRLQAKLTQKKLAELLGISVRTLQMLEEAETVRKKYEHSVRKLLVPAEHPTTEPPKRLQNGDNEAVFVKGSDLHAPLPQAEQTAPQTENSTHELVTAPGLLLGLLRKHYNIALASVAKLANLTLERLEYLERDTAPVPSTVFDAYIVASEVAELAEPSYFLNYLVAAIEPLMRMPAVATQPAAEPTFTSTNEASSYYKILYEREREENRDLKGKLEQATGKIDEQRTLISELREQIATDTLTAEYSQTLSDLEYKINDAQAERNAQFQQNVLDTIKTVAPSLMETFGVFLQQKNPVFAAFNRQYQSPQSQSKNDGFFVMGKEENPLAHKTNKETAL